MKSIFFSITLLATIITFFSCKQTDNTSIDYKYSKEKNIYTCQLSDIKLINEAIYSIENDLNNAFDKKNKSVNASYSTFIAQHLNKSFKIEEVASKHSLKIAKALQKSKYYKDNIFLYNSELANCIFDNIKNENTKKSFKALKKANSLRPNVVLPTIRTNSRNLITDKGLAGILAFDYYYNSLMLLTEEQLKSSIESANQENKF